MNANAEASWEKGGIGVTDPENRAKTVERRSNEARERAQPRTIGDERFSPDPLQTTDRYRLVTPYTLRM